MLSLLLRINNQYPEFKVEEIYFGSHFVEVSIQSLLAPNPSNTAEYMAEEKHLVAAEAERLQGRSPGDSPFHGMPH